MIPSVFSVVNEGSQLYDSRFTYEDYIQTNFNQSNITYVHMIPAFDNIYFLGHKSASNTYFLRQYNPSTETLTDLGTSTLTLPQSTTYQSFGFFDDLLSKYKFYVVGRKSTGAQQGLGYGLLKYSYNALLTNGSVSYQDFDYNASKEITATRSGFEMLRIKDNSDKLYYYTNYYSNGNDIVEIYDDMLYPHYTHNNLTSTYGRIISMVTDGEFIYLMTSSKMLLKLDDNINIIKTVNTSANGLNSNYYYNWLFYNPITDKILAVVNDTTIKEYSTNLIYSNEYTVPNMNYDESSGGHDINPIFPEFNNFYMINDTEIFICDTDGICLTIDNRTNINNDNQMNLSFKSAPYSAKINGYGVWVYGDSMYYVNNDTNGLVDIIRISGFEDMDLFNDEIIFRYIDINTTPIQEGDSSTVSAVASHYEGDSYLNYAFTCYGDEKVLEYESFTSASVLNSSFNYNNSCSFNIDNSYFNIDEKAVQINNCSDGLEYTLESYTPTRFTLKYYISTIENHTTLIELYDNNTNKILNFTIDYSQQVYNVYENGTLILNTYLDKAGYLLPYTEGNIYTFEIIIDVHDDNYLIGLYPSQNDDLIEYSEKINLTTNINKIYKYKIMMLGDNSYYNELYSFELNTKNIPDFSSSDSTTCTYSDAGIYKVCAYVTSTLNEDYNTFICDYIEVLPFEISDVGSSFDDVLNMSGWKGANFWKFIMFIGFSIIILLWAFRTNAEYGVYVFLFAETLMLWFMSGLIQFFPFYYFIIVLVLDALIIAGLIMRTVIGQ